ncbi:hypothetical protein [Dysgonomonas sp. 521]|uniref:hypothetical protein n=1 Tax=Dysgonomonas sp. 521 TaxID=2302932 RepID=UPI0013D0ADBD|nr:hypothetical protein [Dysgonomonas sp. 521]
MSKRRHMRRLAARKELINVQKNSLLKRYLSVISISTGAVIGLILWLLFFKCKDIHCVNSFFPIPHMGFAGFNAWVIANYFFRK